MRQTRASLTAIASLALALAVTACGSSSSSSSSTSTSSTSGKSGGTITEVFGTAPDSLDPGMAYTTQALEPDQVVYTTLLVYQHVAGTAGGTLIPGLATALPTISPDGKTYTLTLRSGLKFSNGTPVVASNFTYAVERALKIPWGGSSFITANVVGRQRIRHRQGQDDLRDHDRRRDRQDHDQAGQRVRRVLRTCSRSRRSPRCPRARRSRTSPPTRPLGVGPYKFSNIVPNVSYSVVRNPDWTPIPGIPSGSFNQINVKISSNTTANALSVLNNSVDIFDFADTVPPGVLPQVQSQAASRYSKIVQASTYYFFLNSKAKPFSSQLAREAVVVGLDRNALARLGSGYFIPGCYLLPPTMVGHATQPCPYGDPAVPNLAKAKALVKQSGMAGTPVTVWGEERSPRRQFIDYYTSFLNQIGFKATEKIIADASYFPTIGNLKLNPQTGFADWNQDFPNPIDFYGILAAGDAISPTNNQNFGQINDPTINAKVNSLGSLYKVPSAQLSSFASQWQQLDYYAAQKAYFGVFGYASFAKFTSSRIDYNAAVLHQVYGWDWLTLKVK